MGYKIPTKIKRQKTKTATRACVLTELVVEFVGIVVVVDTLYTDNNHFVVVVV